METRLFGTFMKFFLIFMQDSGKNNHTYSGYPLLLPKNRLGFAQKLIDSLGALIWVGFVRSEVAKPPEYQPILRVLDPKKGRRWPEAGMHIM
jgi:hypothetical protein